jgi:hypothetical protein
VKRIVLHIGLEKTGTTSFQAYCAENRARLNGALYPVNPACFLDINHAPLAASYFSAAEASALAIAGRRAERRQAVAALKAEIGEAPTTLLSAEHFSSRFDPGRIAALRADLADYEVSIAVVLRDPQLRAISAYATAIASGRDTTLDAFVDELCGPANPYLRSRATLEAWSSVFGREHIIVFSYHEGGDIVPALFERLFPEAPREAGAARRNVSPSAEETERRRRANARGAPGRFAGRIAHRLTGGDAPGRRPTLSPEQSRRIAAAVAADLDWLKQEYGIAWA